MKLHTHSLQTQILVPKSPCVWKNLGGWGCGSEQAPLINPKAHNLKSDSWMDVSLQADVNHDNWRKWNELMFLQHFTNRRISEVSTENETYCAIYPFSGTVVHVAHLYKTGSKGAFCHLPFHIKLLTYHFNIKFKVGWVEMSEMK